MTDAELITMARAARVSDHTDGALYGRLADRIEALIAERDEAYEIGYRDGESSMMADWMFALSEQTDAPDIDSIDDAVAYINAAEAEVERLRGLLRHAGVALWETGVDHPVLQDIDDALPPGWAAQARKDTP